MPRAHRHTERTIIQALKEVEAGAPVEQVCRRLLVAPRTFYKWRAKFGGLEENEAVRLRQLEDENRRLRNAVADLTLDKKILQELVSKKF
jgi:putative transposase